MKKAVHRIRNANGFYTYERKLNFTHNKKTKIVGYHFSCISKDQKVW